MKAYARYCRDCPCAAECRSAFGKFWRYRSTDGIGCDKPFDGAGASVPPRPPVPMSDRRKMALTRLYVRRLAAGRERFKDWTPQELDFAVCAKYPGRTKRRYGPDGKRINQ